MLRRDYENKVRLLQQTIYKALKHLIFYRL